VRSSLPAVRLAAVRRTAFFMRQRVVLFAAQTDVIGRPAALGFYRAAHFVFL